MIHKFKSIINLIMDFEDLPIDVKQNIQALDQHLTNIRIKKIENNRKNNSTQTELSMIHNNSFFDYKCNPITPPRCDPA